MTRIRVQECAKLGVYCLEASMRAVLQEAAADGKYLRPNDIAKRLGLEGYSGSRAKNRIH